MEAAPVLKSALTNNPLHWAKVVVVVSLGKFSTTSEPTSFSSRDGSAGLIRLADERLWILMCV